MTELRALADGLWESESTISLVGAPFPRRMTVARLADGGLWVHSPNRLDPATRAAVDALGPVRSLVSPNQFHHFFVDEWAAAYPEARRYAAPGLPEKRRELEFHAVLGDAPPPEWAGLIDQRPLAGIPRWSEVVFLHRPSRTLILTDLAFQIGREAPFATRLLTRATGVYGRFAFSRLLRLLVVDRAALRASIEALLEWEFDRVLMAHGRALETGGRVALEGLLRGL